MCRKSLLLSSLILILTSHADARIFLLWEFPRSYQPAPVEFLIDEESLTGITGTQRLVVVPVAPGVCHGLPSATPDTFCTEIKCPGIGVFRFVAYALYNGGVVSGGSNTVNAVFITLGCLLPTEPPIAVVIPPKIPAPPSPCATAAYTPTYLPVPTTTAEPTPITLSVSAQVPLTSLPPAPQPRIAAPVLTQPPVIIPRVTPKAVIPPGSTSPVASSTVYAGLPQQVALTQPQVQPYATTPCPQ